MYSIKNSAKAKIVWILELTVFFLFIGLSFAQELSYRKMGENKLELKAGGETFSLDGHLVLQNLGIKNNTYGRVTTEKKIGVADAQFYISGIKEIVPVIDTDFTKKIKVIFSVKSKKGNKTDNLAIEIVLQIWKGIPAISAQLIAKNISRDVIRAMVPNWVTSLPASAKFYTTYIDGKIMTKPYSGRWVRLPRSGLFLITSSEEAKEGIGIILDKKETFALSSNPHNTFLNLMPTKRSKNVLPEQRSIPFKVILISVKEGFSQISKIEEKIKNFKKLERREKDQANQRDLLKQNTHFFSRNGLQYFCKKFKTPPSIDGALKDWKGVVPIHIDKIDNIVVRAVHPWRGPQDLSADLYLGYDNTNLYLALETVDEFFQNKNFNDGIWRGDCLQFVVDTLNKEVGTPDCEYCFALTGEGPQVWCWHGPVKGKDIKDIQLSIKEKNKGKKNVPQSLSGPLIDPIDHGLIYEIAIPWKYISSFNPFRQKVFGFNFMVGDDDGSGFKQYLNWSKQGHKWKSPDVYGKILFELENLSEKSSYANSSRIFTDKEWYQEGENIKLKIYTYSPQKQKRKMLLSLLQGKTPVYSQKQSVNFKEGLNDFTHILKAKEAGKYRCLVSFYDQGDKLVTGAETSFLLLSKKNILNVLERVKSKITLLKSLLEKAETLGVDIRLTKVALGTIKIFIPKVEEDLKYKNFYRANNNANYLLKIAEAGVIEIKEMIKYPKKRISIPKYNLGNLQIKDGFFYSDKTPVFFFGPIMKRNPEELPLMSDIGFNLVQWWSAIQFDAYLIFRSEANTNLPDMSIFDKIWKQGMMNAPLPTMWAMPKWFAEKYPEAKVKHGGLATLYSGHVSLEHPRTRQFYEKYYRTIIPLIKDKPALLSYYLMGEVAYSSWDRSLFQKYLKEKYKNIHSLNNAWNASYKNFNEVTLPPLNISQVANFPQFQDHCLFNHKIFFEFWSWIKNIIREYDKKRPMHVDSYTCGGEYWQTAYRRGFDREMMAGLDNMIGCDDVQYGPVGEYTCNFWSSNFGYDLLHSFAPEKVLSDDEWHVISDGWFRSEKKPYSNEWLYSYIRTGMWSAFVRGVGKMHLWGWRDQYRSGKPNMRVNFWNNVSAQPTALYSAGRTALELNRLAKYLVKFSQSRGEVALLYSLYSIPNLSKFPSSHEPDLRKAYEGTSFLDTKVTFISERQIQKGLLKNYKLVIITSAKRVQEETYQRIKKYIDAGGNVLILGNSLQYDEYEKPREISQLISGNKIKIGNLDVSVSSHGKGKVYYIQVANLRPKEIASVVDAILDETGVERDIRVVNQKGKNVWGVECRTVRADQNKYLVYLINISKKKIEIKLKTGKKIQKIYSLIDAKEVTSAAFTLNPMDPVLLMIEM